MGFNPKTLDNGKRFPRKTNAERQQEFAEWNKLHKNDPWVITNMKVKVEGEATDLGEPSHTRTVTGAVIYTPHECEFPDIMSLPLGTIWECHGYAKKSPSGLSRMCYDKWIITSEQGVRQWELFERSF